MEPGRRTRYNEGSDVHRKKTAKACKTVGISMNIIAGKLKGKKLFFVQNRCVRPMTQKVREAIFDILRDRIEGTTMLDLFCGSGSVGIEALSRGAARVDFVDLDVRTVIRNVNALGIDSSAAIYRRDALKVPQWLQKEGKAYGFIFIGAPYDYDKTKEILSLIGDSRLLKPGGLLMVEHRKGTDFPEALGGMAKRKIYRYGQTLLTTYGCEPPVSCGSPEGEKTKPSRQGELP
jgi:16S rRNA (guanine(966)-N(2))-methyltransferase RsmD